MGKAIVRSLLWIAAASGVVAKGAEPRLERIRIYGHEIKIEIVESDADRSRGLMYRTSLPKDQGMLFVFPATQPLTFWMKNTKIPLSIGFFSESLKLVDVKEMEPESFVEKELPRYSSRVPATLALEMNKDWFKNNKVPLGARIEFLNTPRSERLRELQKAAKH